MLYFLGIVKPHIAEKLKDQNCMLSVNRLQERLRKFEPGNWMLDCGSYHNLITYGEHQLSPEEYEEQVVKWSYCGNLMAAVCQDYICDKEVLEKTRLTVGESQEKTIENYRRLKTKVNQTYILPVLQGQEPNDFVKHLEMYGYLEPNAWIGVGSLPKRLGFNIEKILLKIKSARPDLRLHGFGLGIRELSYGSVKNLLYSADSAAWTINARKRGFSPHDLDIAREYVNKVASLHLLTTPQKERQTIVEKQRKSIVDPHKILKKIQKEERELLPNDLHMLNSRLEEAWTDAEVKSGKRILVTAFKRVTAVVYHARKAGWFITEGTEALVFKLPINETSEENIKFPKVS
jgi:hypothetical protein